ncbi:MAG: DNA-binding transcriptional repressor YgbI [Acidobacteriota bacterium]
MRRERLAELLRREGYLSVSELASRFRISEATVRRDLRALEEERRITRTHGGALFEYDELFVPFYQRHTLHQEAKRRIAKVAASLVHLGQIVYLDAGSTVFALAEEVAERGLEGITFVTNSLPVAEVLKDLPESAVHLLGGCLLPHQLTVLGEGAELSLCAWRFDVAFLGAEAMDHEGLWNSRDEIVSFQRHVCGRSEQAIFLVDASKIGRRAPSLLLPWGIVEAVVTDATEEQIAELGRDARRTDWIFA